MVEGIWGQQTRLPSARELSTALAARAEDVCRHYLPGGTRAGRYWQAGDVSGAKGQSLYAHLSGPRAGRWVDAATQERGDLLDLIRLAKNHPTLRAAMEEASEWLGGAGPAPVAAPERRREERSPADSAKLERFLRSAQRVTAGNAGGRYLIGRGLSVEDAAPLRYHPSAWVQVDGELRQVPAVLAPIRAPDGRLEAVHRIFITPGGEPAAFKARKRNSGSPQDGVVWLGPRNATRVALLEGVEDALAVMRALDDGEKASIAAVATTSSGRIPWVKFPVSVREVFYVQDRDEAGERAWEGLQERHRTSGIRLERILPDEKVKDPNQELLDYGADHLRRTLAPLTEPARLMTRVPGDPDPLDRTDSNIVADLGLLEEIEAEGRRLAGEAVAVRFSAALGDNALGRYQDGVITLALASGDEMRSAMSHEVIHALRSLGAFSDEDWETLRQKAIADWLDDPEFGIRERYGHLSEEGQIEEAVAEGFRRWHAGLPTESAISRVFARIHRLVAAVRDVFGRRGVENWEGIFREIERGDRRRSDQARGVGGPAEARRRGSRRRRGKRPDSGPSPAEIERRRAQRLLDDPRPDLSEKAPVPIVEVGDLSALPRRGLGAMSQLAAGAVEGSYRNADTGLNVRIGRDAVGKALSKNRAVLGRALSLALPELLRTAVRFQTSPDTKKRPHVLAYHSLLAAIRVSGQDWRVLLHVRHTRSGCVSWGVAVAGRVGRTSRRILSRGSFTPAAWSRPTVVEIAELIRTVKYDDKETFVALTQSSETREMRAAPAEAQTAGAREYDRLIADWREFEAEAKRAWLHPFYAPGYDRLHQRMADLAARADIPGHGRQVLAKRLEVHGHLTERHDRVEEFLAAVDRNWERRQELAADAQTADIFLVQTEGYPRWREDAEELHAAGTAILADPDLELHLEEIPLGRALTRDAIERFERYRAGDSEIEAHIAAAPKKADWSWETAREGMRFDEQPTARPEASVSLHM